MQELIWLDHLPDSTLEGGIALANQLYWNITAFYSESHQHWYVKSGESLIFKTDSQEALNAFLYGMGLAYSVLPELVFENLQAEVTKWVE